MHAAAKINDKSELLSLNIGLLKTLKGSEHIDEDGWQVITEATKKCAVERAQELEAEALSILGRFIKQSDNLTLLVKISKVESNSQLKELVKEHGLGDHIDYLLQENSFERIADIAIIRSNEVVEQQTTSSSIRTAPDAPRPSEQNQEVSQQLKALVHTITTSYKGSDEKRETLMELWSSVNDLYIASPEKFSSWPE